LQTLKILAMLLLGLFSQQCYAKYYFETHPQCHAVPFETNLKRYKISGSPLPTDTDYSTPEEACLSPEGIALRGSEGGAGNRVFAFNGVGPMKLSL
jgi:hypothetical protein